MAVDDNRKSIKKKNSNNSKTNKSKVNKDKTKDKIKKEKELIKDTVVNDNVDDTDITNEDITSNNDKDNIITDIDNNDKEEVNEDKISLKNIKLINKKNVLFLTILISIILIIYICIPRINLVGGKEIVLNYDQDYVEYGCKGEHLLQDIDDNIKITSNIVNNKVGNYEVNYEYDFLLFKINKTRKVTIIDDKEPIIEVESDTIKMCPNEDINNIEYKATDEYDGDITDKVILNEIDNRLTLSVNDSSNNYSSIDIEVNRIDDEVPSISLSGSSTMYLNIGSSYSEPGYSASDNCDGDLTDSVVVTGSVNTNVIGEHIIKYSVTDSSENTYEIERKVIVRNRHLYNNGVANNGSIYLTFDDGPNADTTGYILDVLKEEGVKATFFVTCNGPDYLIKRMYDEGHTVALHTATHDYSYVYSSVDNYFNDLQRVSDRVKRITGEESKIIRFPGGSSNTTSRNFKLGIMSELTSLVLDRGYRYYDWNIDSNDAGGASTSSQVYYNVINNLYYNRANMVLMHDIKYTTKNAIRDIIIYGKNNGYSFEKITMDTYMIRHRVNN